MGSNTLLVSVIYFGHIPLLGINGPMVNPQAINRGIVQQLVARGYEVYSHNPHNHSQKKRLDNSNIYTNLWPAKEPEPVKPVVNIGTPVPNANVGLNITRKTVDAPTPAAEPIKVAAAEEVKLPEPAVEAKPEPAPKPTPVVDPYAGMSKNQRKKAKAAAARAAAERAAANKAGE